VIPRRSTRPPARPDNNAAAVPANQARTLDELNLMIAQCRACPRLVAWRELVAAEKRAAYRDETYWGRPVPSMGSDEAWLLVVGLAPAAHGGNRTGRMFTGDRSGDVLFAALHRAGIASQEHSVAAGDGMTLTGARLTAPVHCAPPDNKPTPAERDNCAPYLGRELELLAPTLRVAVVLGAFGWHALLASLDRQGWRVPRPRPKFGHGVEVDIVGPQDQSLTLLGCYHVSQQNTFTGKLTPAMLDAVLARARQLRSR
jgi:uracil-DNA glycosylase